MDENGTSEDESGSERSPIVGESATGRPPGGMPTRVERVPDEEWASGVRSVPIVSVDLVVLTPDDGLVPGRREINPQKERGSSPAAASRRANAFVKPSTASLSRNSASK